MVLLLNAMRLILVVLWIPVLCNRLALSLIASHVYAKLLRKKDNFGVSRMHDVQRQSDNTDG